MISSIRRPGWEPRRFPEHTESPEEIVAVLVALLRPASVLLLLAHQNHPEEGFPKCFKQYNIRQISTGSTLHRPPKDQELVK